MEKKTLTGKKGKINTDEKEIIKSKFPFPACIPLYTPDAAPATPMVPAIANDVPPVTGTISAAPRIPKAVPKPAKIPLATSGFLHWGGGGGNGTCTVV